MTDAIPCGSERGPKQNTITSNLVVQVVFPAFFFVLAGATPYVISKQNTGERINVIITLMLTQVAFQFITSEMLPRGNGRREKEPINSK